MRDPECGTRDPDRIPDPESRIPDRYSPAVRLTFSVTVSPLRTRTVDV